ncbi:zf-HC2 domain-containing protein [Thalassobacillus hwangdonensis]|uniref:Zf-HC2 domain-containing protein n=1 Tax=Thalassobacillus hwangdonensis TaxID=546108 RepID=A0ABW3L3Y7_9BACI
MKHLTETQLSAYLSETMDESEKLALEHHLEQCESCFHDYLTAMEEWDPAITLSGSFTDEVMTVIGDQVAPSQPASSKKRMWINFSAAAGLTLILTVSGLFHEMVSFADQKEFKQAPSITEKMMTQTNELLDGMKKGDDKNE